ncbi:uncharacterized protein AMSG_07328 [Thecamonas trahens ATCC 50062]|uniref:SUI1 domain-containing protein n=1 Tax=Thecamonas trahens ATCC 50062 TaxID=461836 RepID=A0A0L0DG49_THETB|nr:hypothetical protein AMSG_07328 [Thecamonas trahens ATCC 50062]KNC51317.1 hypothetical protein AMSG_07328 [Thecamonas trahens ATCC 50062]|eukprot:XP_013756239.1 hypothetical protein AMSG_07328 [Thecamonas trahens ATCC 50062]
MSLEQDFGVTFDPFQEAQNELVGGDVGSYVHIRIQQRNGRKSLTTVQGLTPKLNFKRVLKALKKSLACNGNIVEDEENGTVIQLQGDQRAHVQEFLVNEQIVDAQNIKVHGF